MFHASIGEAKTNLLYLLGYSTFHKLQRQYVTITHVESIHISTNPKLQQHCALLNSMWSRFPLCPIPPKEMEGPSTRVDKGVAIAVQRAHKMKGSCGFYLMQFLLGQPREHCPIWDWCIWATNQTSNVSFALNHNVMKFWKKTCNTQKLGKCSLGASKHHKLQSKAWVTCNVIFNYLIGNWTSSNNFTYSYSCLENSETRFGIFIDWCDLHRQEGNSKLNLIANVWKKKLQLNFGASWWDNLLQVCVARSLFQVDLKKKKLKKKKLFLCWSEEEDFGYEFCISPMILRAVLWCQAAVPPAAIMCSRHARRVDHQAGGHAPANGIQELFRHI